LYPDHRVPQERIEAAVQPGCGTDYLSLAVVSEGVADGAAERSQVKNVETGVPGHSVEGEPVDKRSDLFSLGAILYHMVTGYGFFQGNSATTLCFKVANHDPLRATAIDPDLPPELDSIIARANG
jgi:serine/threonine protein kinase